ncbi:MAG TPA: class A beta-lactamase [Pseudonocardia sp.]|nr:class A beta-lactamase [Pseudonocardia sp.]
MRSSPPRVAHLRRAALLVLGAAVVAVSAACTQQAPRPSTPVPAASAPPTAGQPAGRQSAAQSAAQQSFEQLERSFGARLGVYALDTGNGATVSYRADERFAYASTHKVFTAAAVLARTAIPDLNRRVPFGQADLVDGAPVTRDRVGAGMTVRELIDAALRYSDNTADDLLFREIGGPPGLAAFMRSLGDTTSHVDRIEPELNVTAPGDIRDTTTARAYAADLRSVVLGTVLPDDRRAVLTDMMRANTTGATVIRAGVPASWQVADKTGNAGYYATRNDIAVAWPPGRPPLVIVIFSDRPGKDDKVDDKLIAQAASVVATAFR